MHTKIHPPAHVCIYTDTHTDTCQCQVKNILTKWKKLLRMSHSVDAPSLQVFEVGQGPEQPDLMGGIPAHGGVGGLGPFKLQPHECRLFSPCDCLIFCRLQQFLILFQAVFVSPQLFCLQTLLLTDPNCNKLKPSMLMRSTAWACGMLRYDS